MATTQAFVRSFSSLAAVGQRAGGVHRTARLRLAPDECGHNKRARNHAVGLDDCIRSEPEPAGACAVAGRHYGDCEAALSLICDALASGDLQLSKKERQWLERLEVEFAKPPSRSELTAEMET